MKPVLAVVLPPLIMLAFISSERNFALYESGVLALLGVAFLGMLAVSVGFLVGRWRGGLAREIGVSVALASTPFWGEPLGMQPNVHGFSMLLWALFLLVAWAVSGYLAVRAVVRAARARRGLQPTQPS